MAALSLGLFFVPLYLLSSGASNDVNSMQANLLTIRRSLTTVPTPLPEVRDLLTPLAQVQGQIAQVRSVYTITSTTRADWSTVMEAIGRYDPDQISLTTLNRADNRITLTGRAKDETSFVAYVGVLGQSNLFSLVSVQSLQLIDTSPVTLTVTASRGISPNATLTPTLTTTPTPNLLDHYEPDDTQPKPIVVGQAQQHNFMPSGDADSVTALIKAFGFYRVRTSNLAAGVDTVLTVHVGRSTYVNNEFTAGKTGSEVDFQNLGPDTPVLITVTNRGAFGPEKTYSLLLEQTGPPPTSTARPAPTFTPVPSQFPTSTSTAVIILVTATPIASSSGQSPSLDRLSSALAFRDKVAPRSELNLEPPLASLVSFRPIDREEELLADSMAFKFALVLDLWPTP